MQIPDMIDFPVIQEILTERDRGAAIVAGGFLEAKLTEAIRACLRDDKDTARQLLKPTGPLGAFGNKALLGYMLKLYRKESRDDLIRIGEIRNRFAHKAEPMNFEEDFVMERCEKLGLYHRTWSIIPNFNFPPRPYKNQEARKVYLETISLAANFLHGLARNPEFRAKRDDSLPF
jgi:hypothetical protein